MFKRSAGHSQETSPIALCAGDALEASTAGFSLTPVGVRFLASGFAVWAAVLVLLSRMDLGVMGAAVQDVLLSTSSWEWLITRVHMDEVVLIATARSADLLRTITPGVGNELAVAFASVVAVVLIVGRASVISLVEKIARRRAFRRRQDCRHTSFHYTCDQFWLRVQGR
jgi:hypothetical protein